MKRYAIPLASVVCLALWACAQPAPPTAPPGPPGPVRTVISVPCPASPAWPAGDLLTHVHYTRFTPSNPFTTTPAPDPQAPRIDQTPDIQADLAAAFTANLPFSQNELCPLDGIFINAVGCMSYDPSTCSGMHDTDIADNSWGFRSTPNKQRYVAISLGLWQNNTCQPPQTICAPAFQDYHMRLENAVPDRTVPPNAQIHKPPLSFSASTNTSGLSVLAAIAHERGHIYWFDTFVPTAGGPIGTTNAFCNPPFYPGGIWEKATVTLPKNRFVEFGVPSPNSPVKVSKLPILLQQDYHPSGEVVDGVYASGVFPSLLAAYSPYEAFVEAFELSVLRNAGHRNLTFTVNVNGYSPYQETILANGMASPAVEAQLACFDSLSQAGRH